MINESNNLNFLGKFILKQINFSKPIKSDIQMIDYIFKLICDGGGYAYITQENIYTLEDVHRWDVDRIFRKLTNEGYLSEHYLSSMENPIYKISDLGMEVMKEHGTFKKFFQYKKRQETKKDRRENIDRNFKNGNIIAVSIIALLTIYSGQCSNMSKSHQLKIQQGIELASNGLHTPKQYLTKIQKSPRKFIKKKF